jgi:hypothetical protein
LKTNIWETLRFIHSVSSVRSLGAHRAVKTNIVLEKYLWMKLKKHRRWITFALPASHTVGVLCKGAGAAPKPSKPHGTSKIMRMVLTGAPQMPITVPSYS